MAEPKKIVREYKDDDGKITTVVTWQVRWRDPGGRQRKATFDKRGEADRHLAGKKTDKARGQYVDGSNPITVADAVRANLERRSVKGGSYRSYDTLVRCHIEALQFGKRRLAVVLPSEAKAWAADRAKKLGRSSLGKLVGIVRSTYEDAILDRIVAVNPMARVEVPSADKKKVVPLTVEQVIALADAARDQYRAMVLVQAGLGLRIGELLGLRLADVDFLRRTVRIEHQSAERTRKIVDPKTASSVRTLPLPNWVANVLAKHLEQFPVSPDVPCECPKHINCSRVRSGLLFHTRTGSPHWQTYYCGPRVWSVMFAKANTSIREANENLPAGTMGALELPAGTTSHDLRHHFASVLLAAGESVVAVAEWMGHDNAKLVLTTYGHLMQQSDDRMRRAIDAAYGAGADTCAPDAPLNIAIKRVTSH